jgi:hypothetical protein
MTGSGRAVSGREDSVAEDSEADSQEVRLPRFPRRLAGVDETSGEETERA